MSMPSVVPVDRWLSRTPRSVHRARHITEDFLHASKRLGLRDAALLVVSELVSNGVRYAPKGRLLRLRLALVEQTLVIEVHDYSDRPPRLRNPEWSAERGRGLYLVGEYAEWGHRPRPEGPGKVVWAIVKEGAESHPDDGGRTARTTASHGNGLLGQRRKEVAYPHSDGAQSALPVGA